MPLPNDDRKTRASEALFADFARDPWTVGSRVQLRYTGHPHRVPRWLSMEWATIEDFTARGLLIVKPDIEDRLRRIRRDEDVVAVVPAELPTL